MQQIINKKEIPSELIVDVEKMSNLGMGIAKYQGYVIFIDGACPGDKVKIRLGKKNKNFANASVIEIIEPSLHRVKPFCSMQKVCGACQLQYIDYDYQLVLKKQIVEDAMHSILGEDVKVLDVVKSPRDKEYRQKIQYPISETKESKRIVAGYYKQNSHDIVNIKYCPIQPNFCDDIIEYIRNKAKEFKVSGYNEKKHAGDLRHVVIRASEYSKKAIVVLVVNSYKMFESVKNLAQALFDDNDSVVGVALNYNPNKTNLIMGEITEFIAGEEYIEEKLCDKIFKVSAKTFFQVNPLTANNIFEYVRKYISDNFKNPMIMDAYAGISTFGICLSDVAKKCVTVEEVKASVDLATKIIKENGIKNVELHNMDATKFFEKEINTKSRNFDVTVLDPPRKGCSEECLNYILKITKQNIVYVSCNPATLARDLKYLKDNGCKIEYIQPFDMFPHTYHVESVAIISVK